jgi:hypothetical protein
LLQPTRSGIVYGRNTDRAADLCAQVGLCFATLLMKAASPATVGVASLGLEVNSTFSIYGHSDGPLVKE